MARRLTRKQLLKRSEITETAFDIGQWIEKNLVRLLMAAGAVVALAAIVSLVIWFVQQRHAETADMLAQAQREYRQAASTNFQDQDELHGALESFEEVIDRAGDATPGLLAQYYRGALQYQLGDLQAALTSLEAVNAQAKVPDTLRGTVTSLMVDLYVADGRVEEALTLLNGILDDPGGKLPPEQALLKIAQIQSDQGNRAEAMSAYRRIVAEYPQTGAATLARQTLGL